MRAELTATHGARLSAGGILPTPRRLTQPLRSPGMARRYHLMHGASFWRRDV